MKAKEKYQLLKQLNRFQHNSCRMLSEGGLEAHKKACDTAEKARAFCDTNKSEAEVLLKKIRLSDQIRQSNIRFYAQKDGAILDVQKNYDEFFYSSKKEMYLEVK